MGREGPGLERGCRGTSVAIVRQWGRAGIGNSGSAGRREDRGASGKLGRGAATSHRVDISLFSNSVSLPLHLPCI